MPDPRYSKHKSLPVRFLEGVVVRSFRFVNRFRPWHRLGKWIGLGNLLALRIELREHNLHDTDGDLTQPKPGCPFHSGPNGTRKRTEEGTHNDLSQPAMGCKFSRLGRNMRTKVPPDQEKALMTPNPFEISERLLRRTDFKPATGLNLLAAAWIQFQVHDWFGHENEELKPNDDDVTNEGKKLELKWQDGATTRQMVIPRTRPDPDNWPDDPDSTDVPPAKLRSPLNSRFPANRNKDPQWWDASQVYGESIKETLRLRTNPAGTLEPHGRLYLDDKDLLPSDPETGIALSGFVDNWWLGLEILHTLFAKEHNKICDELKAHEPHLSDQEIFETARLINCAIMAKIHTVEWTPGILGHPSIQPALNANWMGLVGHFFGEKTARRLAPWIPVLKDVFTGVPMSETDHHGAPYSLTEEFNAVYRLHPLIPDTVDVKSCGKQDSLKTYKMLDIAFSKARTPILNGASMADVLWSFGIANPGAIVPQNFPDFLCDLVLPEDSRGRVQTMDLAAVDIIRDRERGVPRYCEFRRQLRMPVPETWEELAGSRPDLAGELQRIYGDLEAVDTMVGMFFEKVPQGFGFSDTAFRIFILMASRRLKSDRFFTEDYTEEFYTRTGLEWIAKTGMKEVILRHHRELEFAFKPGANPFGPWQTRT